MSQDTFVAYCRSSVLHQTLGIDVQRMTIEGYCERTGGAIHAWYVDRGPASIELSRLPSRQPQLMLALAHAQRDGLTIIVSCLDRLTRSTAVLASILDGGGPRLVVAETPTASRFALPIYAAVAEEYHYQVSRRIKAGQAVARAKGKQFGAYGRMVGRIAHDRAKAYAAKIVPIIEEIRRGRAVPGWQVAEELNARGYRTITGRPWNRANLRSAWVWFHRQWDSRRFPKGAVSGAPRLVAAAKTREELLRPLVAAYRRKGARTAGEIATRLNADSVTLAGGGEWNRSTVQRLLQRLRGERR